MLPDRAASTELDSVEDAWLDGVGWLHVPSYSLLSEPIGAAVQAMIGALRRVGGRMSIDVSSVAVVEAFGVDRYNALLADLVPDLVFTNESESHMLRPTGSALTIVKDGPRPVRVLGPHGALEVEVPPLPAVADSTGAGDAFAAGYLAAAIRGDGIERSVSAGIDAAAQLLRR
jgi:sugar/nucleoside kinase (ribokinase family)